MSAYLINLATRERLELHDNVLIGRRTDCHLRFDDSRVSRQHAMIRRQDDGFFWYYDLGSSNGSFINDQRVITTRRLSNGDVIRISDHRLEYVGPDEKEGTGMGDEPTLVDIRTVPVLLLVSDIKGYTRFSELLSPDGLAQMVGSWYRECDRIIHFHGGTVDKFIGDAVLAYWLDVGHEARLKALRAAHGLQVACDSISADNSDVFESLDLRLECGVGLHMGKVAHGQMGEGAFTMLGDAVNLAFRLESLTRGLRRNILVSEQFLDGWEQGRGYCEDEGMHEVKGHQAPLHVYSLALLPTA